MRHMLLALVVLASACGSGQQKGQSAAELHAKKVGEAKQEALLITGRRCKFGFAEADSTIVLEVQCPETHRLAVTHSHLRYGKFSALRWVPFSRMIEFGYHERGFNEADVSAPENDESAAFYLEPIFP